MDLLLALGGHYTASPASAQVWLGVRPLPQQFHFHSGYFAGLQRLLGLLLLERLHF